MSEIQNDTQKIVIKFAGDSGDGMQLTGSQFAETSALFGNDIATFPDFPAEIRAPIGTVPGVSGYQIHIGNTDIHTPGDAYDVLVVMNAAALKTNLKALKPNGVIIANTDGFDDKNLRLAKIDETQNPLTDGSLAAYKVFELPLIKLTKQALEPFNLGNKAVERCKNMYVLGIVYWLFHRNLQHSKEHIQKHFAKDQVLVDANIKAIESGYHFAETNEWFSGPIMIAPAPYQAGLYRSINGNQATAMGLLAASVTAQTPLFLGSYPITPASDILHELSKHKGLDVISFQAEDEIAGICSAIGAAYGGRLGITTSSGPGIALKTEAIGLATMLELPLVICNVQRGGPSTGLPTKTEQADLLQALYGRNGESPIVVIAAATPSDCYDKAYMAAKIALEHCVPVMLLSDGFIANGAEPWLIKTLEEMPNIQAQFITSLEGDSAYLPYKRQDNFSRQHAIPGSAGLEHRIGGLEKEHETGNISYEPANHEFMVKLRAAKVAQVANDLPEQTLSFGSQNSKALVIGWGSTYGSIHQALIELNAEGLDVAQMHLSYIQPMPKQVAEIIQSFDVVMVAELNNGQLIKVIRDQFLVDAKGINKIQGQPFQVQELKSAIKQLLQA